MKRKNFFSGVLLVLPVPSTAWAAGGLSDSDVVQMMNNIVSDLSMVFEDGGFFRILAFLVGILFLVAGVLGFLNARAGNDNISSSIFKCIAGCLLMAFFPVLDMLSGTLFNSQASSILSSGGAGGAGPGDIAKGAAIFAVFLVRVVGYFAIFKGFSGIYSASRGHNSSQMSIVTFIVGGAICVNVTKFLGLIANTLGGKAVEFYNSYISGL